VRAWEAGAFDQRVELIDGEVWPVVIGNWHGRTTFLVGYQLMRVGGGEVSGATLPASGSLPDPDCWVLRPGAEPTEAITERLSAWRPGDVLVVVEVSDETLLADLNIKARLYGEAGFPVYWVVTREGIYEHLEPGPGGYRTRALYRRGDRIPVAYAGTDLAVDDLLAPD
jgi:Uma2 family endonuclease